MKNLLIKPAATILFCLVVFVNGVLADTHITSDTTWSGTVNVSTQIVIDNGATLTILPGTNVVFTAYAGIEMSGRIMAIGTRTDSIRFYPGNIATGWGGIVFENSTAADSSQFRYCVISYGKVINSWGGAFALFYFDNLLVSNCNFHHNHADYSGGAIYCKGSSPRIVNNIFAHNSSSGNGGAIAVDHCDPVITDNLFTFNTASDNGGAIDFNVANRPVINNTFSGNHAGYSGGAINFDYYSGPAISNCIFYDDECDWGSEISISNNAFSPGFYYCILQGGLDGIGGLGGSGKVGAYVQTLDTIPYFTGSGIHPFSLQPSSPCVNSGTPDTTGLKLPSEDLAGNYRIAPICADRIDRGAYEYQEISSFSFSGAISSDTYWCADTVKITGNVTINNGVTLTIGKGVLIDFTGYYTFTVSGRIIAEGTGTELITFSAPSQTPGWAGMIFNNVAATNDSSRLVYCKFENGNAADRGSGNHFGGALYVNNSSKLVLSNSIFFQNSASTEGGALYATLSDLAIRNCTFTYNEGNQGAAISGNNATFSITGCNFSNNTTNHGGCWGLVPSHAGAIQLLSCTAIISNNLIAHNHAGCNGGGIWADMSTVTITNDSIDDNVAEDCTGEGGGGALHCRYSTLTMNGCSILNNRAPFGGGIYLDNVGGEISYNTISGNSTIFSGCDISEGGGIVFANSDAGFKWNNVTNNSSDYAGGIAVLVSNPPITGNLISGNSANINGGGLLFNYASPVILNNTICSNTAPLGPGLYFITVSSPVVRNDVIYGNTLNGASGAQIFLEDNWSNPDIYYTDLQGGISGIAGNSLHFTGQFENNISQDPGFAGTGDYPSRLRSGSPCMNTGDPATNTATAGITDLAGEPRIQNGRIDMGAYETTGISNIYAGSAIHFTQADDSIVLDHAGQFVFDSAFTVEFWLKADPMSNDYHSIIKKGNDWEIQLFFDEDLSIIEFGINWNSVFGYFQTTGDFLVNHWNHIAAVFDPTPGNEYVTIYVNGVQGASNQAEPISYDSDPVTIGSGILGQMDELRIWDTARSMQQIREDMHLVVAAADTGLMTYHQFNGYSGGTVVDIVGGNNGTLMNMSIPSCFVSSTVPAAGGVSNQQIISNPGIVDFSGTDLAMNISAIASTDTIIVSRLDTLPNINPPDANTHFPRYWIVETYGGGEVQADLTFGVMQDLTPQDQAEPDMNRLYQRDSNSDSSWTFVENSSSVDLAGNTVTFTGVGPFCQFAVPHKLFPDQFAGDALLFNGVNESVSIGSLYNTSPEAVTIEAWVYPEDLTVTESYVFYHGDNGEIGLVMNKNWIIFHVKLSNQNWYNAIAPPPEANVWQHMCGVWSSEGSLSLYLDGRLAASATIPALSLYDPGPVYPPSIGSYARQNSFFTGKLDEIRVWDVARTTGQIRENMHLTLAGGETGLIGYWQFNDGSGMSAKDHAGNHDGTLMNMDVSSWVTSSIPAGRGASISEIISSPGPVAFPGTGLQMNFIRKTGTDTIVATRIDTIPIILPMIDTTFDARYWVIHKYGNGFFSADVNFTIGDSITAYDEAHPQNLKLLSRPWGSDSYWASVNNADSADAGTKQVSFSGITAFSQFVIGKGIYPGIAVNPDSVVFSRTPSTVSVTDSILVISSGTDTLKVTNITHGNPQITLSETQLTLISGGRHYLKITYHPTTEGIIRDTIRIASNDANHPVVTIPVRGQGFLMDTWPGTALLIGDESAYIEVPDNNTLDMTANYTLEAWIYPITFSHLGGIISKYQSANANGYTLRSSATAPYTGLNFDGLSTGQGVLAANRWYHISAVNSNGTRVLYVNGVSQPLTGTANTVSSNNDPLCIGVDYLAYPKYFDGNVDEVRVWNVARTEQEIRENMHLTLKGNETGLVSYWQINEGSGHTVTDKINMNNGTTHNCVAENWIRSTITAGGGTSFTNLVSAPGQADFPGTGVSMDFIDKTGSDQIVVSRIDSTPNRQPVGQNGPFRQPYWVVHQYGTGTFSTNVTFTLGQGVTPGDGANPQNILLYQRGCITDTSWGYLSRAAKVSPGTSQATYNGITSFSQFIAGSSRIIYVKSNATGTNNGSSWTNACTSFQAALDSVRQGGQVRVAAGTYKPSSTYDIIHPTSRNQHFRMKQDVMIAGGYAGTEPDTFKLSDRNLLTNETILSGDLNSNGIDDNDCYHVFYHPAESRLSGGAVLDGFTIRGGNANGGTDFGMGGGMFNDSNSPAINNCIFTGNYGLNGGGMSTTNTSSPAVTNSLFANNSATPGGGGIWISSGSDPVLTNCTLANNSALTGGGIECSGSCAPVLNNCIVWGNIASGSGAPGNQFFINQGTITLNYSCYGNGTGDVYLTGGGVLTATNNDITGDPYFINAADSDFRIFGNSPCSNTGYNSYNSIPTDVRGQVRIQNTIIDMGAYEWTEGVDPLAPTLTWTGAISSDWNTAGNWSPNTVPAAQYSVVIPVVATQYPVVSNDPATPAVCFDLTIASGATVNVTSGKAIIVTGTVTIQ